MDAIDWKNEAIKIANDHRSTIKLYIADGWKKQDAVDHVLNGSTIGSGLKAQIRYEFK